MAHIVGGLRHRLIKESLYSMVNGSLTQLGWFDLGRVNSRVTLRTIPYEVSQEIPLNTAVLSTEDMTADAGELGSNMAELSWTAYVDFYAESDAVGQHFIGDVYDVLSGRMSSIGRGFTSFPVYDYRQATPPILFYCDIEEPMMDRAHDFPSPWQKHWYAVRFFVLDAYGDDMATDSIPPPVAVAVAHPVTAIATRTVNSATTITAPTVNTAIATGTAYSASITSVAGGYTDVYGDTYT